VVLRGESPETFEATLLTFNERIRASVQSGDETMLFVYFSGHADAEALHMNGGQFPIQKLEQLVRGSSATLRLLTIDACRSGSITRRKGGKQVAPFALRVDDRLAGQGVVFLTSAAANEDAQESDALGGSFFTHALTSGLLGAADANGDGLVVLDEAYRYAYESTLRATAATFAGPQHPSYRFDLSGQGKVVLADLTANAPNRASIRFPEGPSYLLVAGTRDGAVVAEVGANDAGRRLVVRPGTYFVRGRAPKYLLEGELVATAGKELLVENDRLARVDYARLVRKGGGDRSLVHGFALGAQLRTPIESEGTACFGAYLGYKLHFRALTLEPRLGWCQSRFENVRVESVSQAFDLGLRVSRSWDVSFFSFDMGLSLGAGLFHQSFTTAGRAPDRTSLVGSGSAFVGATVPLGRGFELSLGLEGALYAMSIREGSSESFRALPALRGTMGFGWLF
ncbi:MAG: caspase family protein, partial [Polyangiaceae bacterium]|nr:caspase family protein [Polyangiaceae bacterium]